MSLAVGRAAHSSSLDLLPPGRTPPYFMYLLYLDDSGSAQNIADDYLVLGGIAVYEAQIHWLTIELDKLVASLFPALPPNSVEFHASVIHAGRADPWKGVKPQTARADIIKNVLDVVAASYDTARCFAVAVHKDSFKNHDYMLLAFEDLCSRFNMYLSRINAGAKNRERGLLVLDKSSYETNLQTLALQFRSLGTKWGVLHNIVEVPFFLESTASRLIQVADHIAYAVYRRYNTGDTSFLDRIIKKFDAHDGVIHGLVHKQYYDQKCLCPACMSRTS